jgi:methionyl-tRNA synthetase
VCRHFEDLALSQGIEAWLRAVFACNQYIDAQAPWTLRKTDPERMTAVLGDALPGDPRSRHRDPAGHPGARPDGHTAEERACRARRRRELCAPGRSGFKLEPPKPIFPRLEMPAESA